MVRHNITSITFLIWLSWALTDYSATETAQPRVLFTLPYGCGGTNKVAIWCISPPEEEELRAVPELVGIANDRCIVLLDPGFDPSCQIGALKLFDARGNLLKMWKDQCFWAGELYNEVRSYETHDGYIWVWGIGELVSGGSAVMNLKVFSRRGWHTVDFTKGIPKKLKRYLRAVLKDSWLKERAIFVSDVKEQEGFVEVYASAFVRERNETLQKYFAIQFTTDGKHFIKAKILNLDQSTDVSLDGRWKWKGMWEQKVKDGVIVVTYSMRVKILGIHQKWVEVFNLRKVKEPWLPTFRLGCIPMVGSIDMDGKKRFHLFLTRGIFDESFERFTFITSQGKEEIMSTPGEEAYIVINCNGELISYVDWHRTAIRWGQWARAAPDGSGYYQLKLLKDKAQILFHPLP